MPATIKLKAIPEAVTPPATVPPLGALFPGAPIPDLITSSIYLCRGQAYDLTVKPPVVKGEGITIGAYGDGPPPVVKFGLTAFDIGQAPNLTIQDIEVTGAIVKDGRFVHASQPGLTLADVRVGDVTSLIEQSISVANVTLTRCVQVGKIQRYFAFIDGDGWLIRYNDLAGSQSENIIRSSSPRTTNLEISSNKVHTTVKGAIDIRKGDTIRILNNEFAGGPIRVGNDGDVPASELASNVSVMDNKSLDGMQIRIVSGASNVTVADNDAPIEISGPDKSDGRLGMVNVSITTDRTVTVFGNYADKAAFDGVKITAPLINQVLGGVVTKVTAGAVK